jgi:hypothetical protein
LISNLRTEPGRPGVAEAVKNEFFIIRILRWKACGLAKLPILFDCS